MTKEVPPTHKSIDGITRKQQTPIDNTKKSSRLVYWKFIPQKWYPLWLSAALLIIAAATVTLLLIHYRPISQPNNNDVYAVIHEVSKHYLLPNDEVPALATVTDKQKLTTPLFKYALNGDKILIYQKNHLAIIYRPAIDRIVAVGPVEITAPANQAQ